MANIKQETHSMSRQHLKLLLIGLLCFGMGFSQVGGPSGIEDANAKKMNSITKLTYHAGNLITNSSFESGLQGWTANGVIIANMTQLPSTLTAWTGRNGLSVGVFPYFTGSGVTSNPFQVKSNTDYTLSFYYKSSDFNPGHDIHPILTVTGGPNSAAYYVTTAPIYSNNADWVLYSTTLHVDSGGWATVSLASGTGKNIATSEMYVDDVLLVEGSANHQGKTGKEVLFVDGLNRPLQTVSHEGALDAVSEIRYDQLGRALWTSLPVGNTGTHTYVPNMFDVSPSALDSYYSSGNLNAGGYAYSQSRYEDSPLGRIKESIGPGLAWVTGGRTIKKYYGSTDQAPADWNAGDVPVIDNSHLSVEMTIGEDGETSRQYTDRLGRVIKSEAKSGSVWISSTAKFDALGNLIEKTAPANDNGTKITSTFAFNSMSQLTSEDIPGIGWTDLRYDRAGNIRFKQTRNQSYIEHSFTYFKYDALGRLVEDGEFLDEGYFLDSFADDPTFPSQSLGETKVHTRYFYDKAPAYKNWCEDAAGTEKILIYPGANPNSTTEFTNLGNAITFLKTRFASTPSYSGQLQLLQAFESRSEDVSPPIGFQISSFPLSTPSQYVSFEIIGIVKGTTEYEEVFGNSFPFAVNWGPMRGRLAQVVHCNTSLAGTPVGVQDVSKTFNYDKYGNVTHVYEYNGYMKDVAKRWQKTEQDYDLLNRVVERRMYADAYATSAGTRFRYAYDYKGRIDAIMDMRLGVVTAKHHYNPLGQLTKVEVGAAGSGQVILEYSYTFQGWPKTISANTHGGKSLFNQVLKYHEGSDYPKFNGSISSYIYSLMQLSGAPQVAAYQFQYDQLNRLLSASTDMFPAGGSTAWDYQYADNGTMKLRLENGTPFDYNYYTGTNMLERVVGQINPSDRNAGTVGNFQYDGAGRLKSDRSRHLTNVKYDDVRDLPSQFDWNSGGSPSTQNSTAYMAYDETGNRVSKMTYLNGVLTEGIHYTSTGKEIRDIKTGALPPQSEYVVKEVYPFGTYGRILTTPVSYVYEAYVKNHLGSTALVYDVTGDVAVFRADYEPYGEMRIRERTASDEITPKFTGKEHDDGTGLDYFGARYYDSDLGVWISPDPARQFASPYAYSLNPINSVDPTGLYSVGQHADGSFSRIDPAFDLFSDNAASVDVAVMSETWSNAFHRDGLEGLIPEWGNLAVIALNHRGLLSIVGELSSEFEYGAGFNSGLEQIPFTNNNPSSVHILPGWENEVHGHPNGLGYLSADDVNTYRFYNMKHNMFTIGKGNGGVNVTNRNIMQNTSRGYIPLGVIK